MMRLKQCWCGRALSADDENQHAEPLPSGDTLMCYENDDECDAGWSGEMMEDE